MRKGPGSVYDKLKIAVVICELRKDTLHVVIMNTSEILHTCRSINTKSYNVIDTF